MELPRVLQVQQFTAAREPELRGLWDTLRALGRLDGSKLLPRHLRRRATSHRRYICKRRPNLLLAAKQQQQGGTEAATAAACNEGGDTVMQDAGTVTAAAAGGGLVRPLNRRQRRRPALLQQHATDSCATDVAAAAMCPSSSSSRRLESHVWHARRMRMGVRFGHVLAIQAVGRARGSRSLLYTAMHTNKTLNPRSRHAQNPNGSSSSNVLGAPPAPAAAGRVCRAVCHDASYCCCLQLQGQQQQLIQLLEQISDTVLLQQQLSQREFLAGYCEVQLVLHQPRKFPLGTLGPARLMWHPVRKQPRQWRPQQQQQQQQGVPQQQQQEQQQGVPQQQQQQQQQGVPQQQQQQQQGVPQQQQQGVPQQQQQQQRRQSKEQQRQQQQRTLWVWCHAAYYKQVHDVIQMLVKPQPTPSTAAAAAVTAAAAAEPTQPIPAYSSISVQSLCSSLRRVELIGPDADLVIRTALQQQQQQQQQPGSSSSSSRARVSQPWTALCNAPLQWWRNLPDGCVLGITAVDPRLSKPLKHTGMFGSTAAAAAAAGSTGEDGGSSGSATTAAAAAQVLKQLIGAWPHNGQQWLPSNHPVLYQAASIPAAAPEVLVSRWRQQQQQAALGLGTLCQQQQQQQQQEQQQCAVTCSLGDMKISSYGITSKLAAAGSSSSNLHQQQQHAADVDMQDAETQLIRSAAAAPTQTTDQASDRTADLPMICPMLWVRRYWGSDQTPGWSLLLPAGWVGPFWQALIFAGAKAAGQQEWLWIAAAHMTAAAPYDYPDSEAAAAAVHELHGEFAAAAARRPLGRLRLKNNMLPFLDWNRIGQQLSMDSSSSSAFGSSSSNSGGSSKQPAAADVCWGAAAQLQAAARLKKQQQRKHRQQLKRQQHHQGQQQQSQQVGIPTQQQQQQGSLLMPLVWYVARSWHVLLAALPQATAAAAQVAATTISPEVLAAGRLRNKAVQRAVQQGLLTWQPKSNTAAVDVTAAVQVDEMQIDDAAELPPGSMRQKQLSQQQQQQQQPSDGLCLVRVAVRVIGKGRCEQGAIIVTAPEPSTVTAAIQQQQQQSAAAGSSSCGVVTLLGYITTAMPRGAPVALYPGGLGFCSVQHLWQLRCRDVTANSSRVLRAWLLNPGSTVLRKVELTLLLDD